MLSRSSASTQAHIDLGVNHSKDCEITKPQSSKVGKAALRQYFLNCLFWLKKKITSIIFERMLRLRLNIFKQLNHHFQSLSVSPLTLCACVLFYSRSLSQPITSEPTNSITYDDFYSWVPSPSLVLSLCVCG